MIQRIQSIFLIIIILMGVTTSFVPILEITVNDVIYNMNNYSTILLKDNTVLLKNMGIGVLQGIIILLTLVILFLFKNRQLQIKLSKLNILLIAFQVAAIVMYNDAAQGLIDKKGVVTVQFLLGSLVPVLSFILMYLTIHFIKKDEKLVRAADRLR